MQPLPGARGDLLHGDGGAYQLFVRIEHEVYRRPSVGRPAPELRLLRRIKMVITIAVVVAQKLARKGGLLLVVPAYLLQGKHLLEPNAVQLAHVLIDLKQGLVLIRATVTHSRRRLAATPPTREDGC